MLCKSLVFLSILSFHCDDEVGKAADITPTRVRRKILMQVVGLKPDSLAFYTLHIGPEFFLVSRMRILLFIMNRYVRK